MLTFKQYIAEMAGALTATKKEKSIIAALKSHLNTNVSTITPPENSPIKNWGYRTDFPGQLPTMQYSTNASTDNPDELHKAISEFTHHVISSLSGTKPEKYEHDTKDSRGDINKLSIRNSNNISDTEGGRPVEDAIITTDDNSTKQTDVNAPKNKITVALDMKVGSGPSAWNPRAITANYRLGEYLGKDTHEQYKKYYAVYKRLKGMKVRGARLERAKRYLRKYSLLPHFDDAIDKYGERRVALRNMIDTLNNSGAEVKNDFVKRIMNRHEAIPQHMKRLQLIHTPGRTEIHDFDHAWDHFERLYPNANFTFVMEKRGRGKQDKTSSFKIFAHHPSNLRKKIHIATFSVSADRAGSSDLKYNVKHQFMRNLAKMNIGTPDEYRALATLEHGAPKPKGTK